MTFFLHDVCFRQHASSQGCPCDDRCICKRTTCRERELEDLDNRVQQWFVDGRSLTFSNRAPVLADNGTVVIVCVEETLDEVDGLVGEFARGIQGIADEVAPARAAAVAVESRCAAAHKEELALAAWAAALVAVLVCLGQLAAERAPPSRSERFKNLEVD